ncbi:MAG: hypothetical protein ABRQ38_26460 [Candidatus Eremiobacterota bacterium]
MQAIREFKRVEHGQIIIDLPEDFTSEEVEVIILPMENKKNEIERKERLRNLLLNGPTINKNTVTPNG